MNIMKEILETKILREKVQILQLELRLLEDDINRKLLAEDRYLVTGVEDGWIKANERIQKQYLESKKRLEQIKYDEVEVECDEEDVEEEYEETEFDKNGCPVHCSDKEDFPDCYCMDIMGGIEEGF